jgi:hypothetical protein
VGTESFQEQDLDPDVLLDGDEDRERSPRPFGLCIGAFEVPDDFDASLPEEILLGFEGR